MLALAGKFPGDYVDGRHSSNPEGTVLDANLGRMPVLKTPEGAVIGQSSAINYYLATTLGMLGSNPVEAAKILSLSASLGELREAYSKMVPWGTEPSAEAIKAFFEDTTANDFTGPGAWGWGHVSPCARAHPTPPALTPSLPTPRSQRRQPRLAQPGLVPGPDGEPGGRGRLRRRRQAVPQ